MEFFEKSNYKFYYDEDLNIDTLKILFSYFHQNDFDKNIISFYQLPNSDYFVVSICTAIDSNDIGYRLFFAKIINGSVKEFFHSNGIIGSWFLRPVFFKNNDTIVILADYGEEHPEGFIVVEYLKDSFKELGCVELAVLNEDGDYEDPSSYVKIRFIDNTLFFDFFEDVVLNPLTRKEIILKKAKHGVISFFYNGKNFINVN